MILLGKYHACDTALLKKLIEDMTVGERRKLSKCSFARLCKEFWDGFKLDIDPEKQASMSRQAKLKFQALKRGFWYKGKCICWRDLVQCAQSQHSLPDIEFPKGKKLKLKDRQESEFDCAIREFEEETTCSPSSYILLPWTKPIQETLIGLDGDLYANTFYVVKFHQKEDLAQRQNAEISQMLWLTFEEGIKQCAKLDLSKRNLLQTIHSRVQQGLGSDPNFLSTV